MAQGAVKIHATTRVIRSQACCAEFQKSPEKEKALGVFLRLLGCPETGQPLVTDQTLADAFGKHDRREIENFGRACRARGAAFLPYWARPPTKKDHLVAVLEAQIWAASLLSIAAQDRVFCAAHPHERLGEQTFRTDVNDLAGTKILRRVRQ